MSNVGPMAAVTSQWISGSISELIDSLIDPLVLEWINLPVFYCTNFDTCGSHVQRGECKARSSEETGDTGRHSETHGDTKAQGRCPFILIILV